MFEQIGTMFVDLGVVQAICATLVTLGFVYRKQIGAWITGKKSSKETYVSVYDKMDWEAKRSTTVCRNIMFDDTPEIFTNRERRAYDNILYRAFNEALPEINKMVLVDFVEEKGKDDFTAYADVTSTAIVKIITARINQLYHDTDFGMPRKELWKANQPLVPLCKEEITKFLHIINEMDRAGVVATSI